MVQNKGGGNVLVIERGQVTALLSLDYEAGTVVLTDGDAARKSRSENTKAVPNFIFWNGFMSTTT
jgi:hypothetical protein